MPSLCRVQCRVAKSEEKIMHARIYYFMIISDKNEHKSVQKSLVLLDYNCTHIQCPRAAKRNRTVMTLERKNIDACNG